MSLKEKMLERLEYHKIMARLSDHTVSCLGRKRVEELRPSDNPAQIRALLKETAEAKSLYEQASGIPLSSMEGMEIVLGHLGKGYALSEQDFSAVAMFLHSLGQLKRFMARWESVSPQVSLYARSLHDYRELAQEIERSIRNGRVSDGASPELGKVRRQLLVQEERMKKKLDAVLHKHKNILQETIISQRNGRYVIPVKKEYRKLLPGTVLDQSSSGQTLYVEPAELSGVQAELSELRFAESIEEGKVLALLTERVGHCEYDIRADMEILGHYDFILAKAKYAAAIGGALPIVNDDGRIRVKQGRHPLLGNTMVPIDFAIGGDYRALIITGPNTGGKTVVLKLVGLLTLMVQSGLLVPAGEGSEFAVYRGVAADIGDGQSLEHSLSTFSAHVGSLVEILKEADGNALVLLDELASGTDPGEGIGLSIAVLEELYRRGATIVATTHYNEIKDYAAAAPGFCNARMEFDAQTLSPLYRLVIGEAGSSHAFHIALRLGMDERIIERSREISRAIKHAETIRLEPPGENAMTDTRGQDKRKRNDNSGRGLRKKAAKSFSIGDCVYIHPLKRTGIVCSKQDERGMVAVMVKGEKLRFNRKRLSLYIERNELYPGDSYDLDQVFETVEVRKARHQMTRKHVEGLTIETPAEEEKR